MGKIRSRIAATALAITVIGGASMLTAAPAQAASSCSILGANWNVIYGDCQASNPSAWPYVTIGYHCWGNVSNSSVQVWVGWGQSFERGPFCGGVGITGVWLIS